MQLQVYEKFEQKARGFHIPLPLSQFLLLLRSLRTMGSYWHILTKSIIYLRVNLGTELSMSFDKCLVTCTHHHSKMQNVSLPLQTLCATAIYSSLQSQPPPTLATTDIFFFWTIVLPFLACDISGTIQHVVFSDWLLSLSDIHFKVPLFISMAWFLTSF